MMSQSRSSVGCWICRLRHKKCDEGTPTCGSCQLLELSCFYDETKPEWMDNGPKQKEMANQIKLEIKRGASRRRGRRRIQNIEREIGDENIRHSFHRVPHPNSRTRSNSFHPPVSESEGSLRIVQVDSGLPSTWLLRPDAQASEQLSSDQHAHGNGNADTDTPISQHFEISFAPIQGELELGFIMSYLDYVFPVLYPFYQPPVLQGGRSWLLAMIMRNAAMYHAVVALTSFFFSVIPMAPGPAHQVCASKTWEELQKQASLAVKKVQQGSQEICHRGLSLPLLDSVYLMGNVVQLLSLEIIIAPMDNWQMHLDVASVLFKQIFDNYGLEDSLPSMNTVLSNLSHPIVVPVASAIPQWNTAQASFRFFSAMLLVSDIISSTALERPPKLREYHNYLLVNKPSSDQEFSLRLEDYAGCENWILLLICEIVSLDVWKKDMKQAGTLSMRQLVQRASMIEQQLKEGFRRLESSDQLRTSSSKPSNPLALSVIHLPQPSSHITRIWAHAAHIYLLVVVSGWNPADMEIQNYVSKTIDLFQKLPSPALLRTLVWPFCVTGCLAMDNQEPIFREMVTSMGALQNFGTMKLALNIMVKVWSRRAQINPSSCDVAICLRCLGHAALLM